jgi:hypothetical protein
MGDSDEEGGLSGYRSVEVIKTLPRSIEGTPKKNLHAQITHEGLHPVFLTRSNPPFRCASQLVGNF